MNEIRRSTVDFAIDLGTSDSVIAYFNGKGSQIIKNHLTGEDHTPSAVFIDDSGEIHIGKTAKDAVIKNPANAVSEFKLNMGFPIPFHFEDANKRMFPEQLSAELLKDLKKSIFRQTGQNVEEIVITVPANSNPLKTRATKEAAELAGFEQVILLQEPTAAAMAYGFDSSNENEIWLIYDFGGGTFDVSIMQKDAEGINNINNQGDAYLGGKLIDWAIVDEIFVPAIVDETGLSDFNRNNPKYLKEFAKLKSAAELAKTEISNFGSAEIEIENFRLMENGEPYDFEYDMEKEELDGVMKPFVDRTINHCKKALEDIDLTIDDVTKIILVGGSTLSPYIHERLTEEFNIPLEFSIDPTTVVARGAAIFAGTKPINLESGNVEIGKASITVKYEPMDLDDEFDIMGTISTEEGSAAGYKVEFINTKTESSSGQIPSNDKGIFMTTLFAEDEDDWNVYEIKIYDADGNPVELDSNSTNTVKYKIESPHGGHILSHTIGLGLVGNKLLVLAEKGTPLPYEYHGTFKTTEIVNDGNPNDRIYMPLYEGTYEKADRNTLIGELKITGNHIERTLPVGSEIELRVNIDESMDFDPFVYIEILDQEFDRDSGIITVTGSGGFSLAELENEFEEQMVRYEKAKKKAEPLNSIDVNALFNQITAENMIGNIQTFLETSVTDPDALDNASKRINEFKAILDDIEQIVDEYSSWDEVKEETDQLLGIIRLQMLTAKPEIQNFYNETKVAYDHAVETRNLPLLIQVKDQFGALFVELNRCDMVKHAFVELANSGEFTDQIAANRLINEGNELVLMGNCEELERVISQLYGLVKQTPHQPSQDNEPPEQNSNNGGGHVDLA